MATKLHDGRYELIKTIGEGGMAEVFLAFDNIKKEKVAIKKINNKSINDEVTKKRFKREVNYSLEIKHTNVVRLYDNFEENDNQYIVLEYIHGRTLKDLIRDREKVDVQTAHLYMTQILSAMIDIHKHKIIHRDIKSENILVTYDGICKITDFGISIHEEHYVDEKSENYKKVTEHNKIIGSVHYMAPEFSREGATVQTDIYALGILFYELLTGDTPFDEESAVETIIAHSKEPMPRVRSFDYSIPQSIENIIIRATAKDKNLRYKTVEQMFLALAPALDADHANEKPISVETQFITKTKKGTNNSYKYDDKDELKIIDKDQRFYRKIWFWWVMLGIVIVALIAIFVVIEYVWK